MRQPSRFGVVLPKSPIALSLLCAAISATANGEPMLSTPVDVFVGGTGYPNYRTPSITAMPDGSLVAIAEGRSFDDPGVGSSDLDIVSCRSTDGGATWSSMQTVDTWTGGSSSNPTTVLDKTTGRLFVLYNRWEGFKGTVDSQPNTTNNTAWMRYSDDGGATWSAAANITSSVKDVANWNTISFGPGSGIQASNGRLMIPSARWINGWNGYAVYSADHGATWTRGTLVPGGNLSGENQLVQLSNGSILMDARNNTGSGVRLDSTSANGGLTWSTMTSSSQSGPDTEAAIERYTLASAGDDRNRIVFTTPSDPSSREDLVVRTSYDESLSYINQRLLYDGYSGYSDITILPDKSIGVLFETNEARSLTFLKFNQDFLEPPQRLSAYEGFRYNTATLGTKNGGLLWNSGWASSPTTLTGTPTAQIVNSDINYTHFPFAITGKRSVSFNGGGSMARALPTPIDLNSNQTWYLSMLMQRNTVGGDTQGSLGALDVLLYSGATRTLSFGVQGDDSLYINLPGYGASTAAGALDRNTAYYLVAKLIATSGAGSNDQLYLKAFRTGDSVPATDDATGWTLAGSAGSNLSSVIDRIAIKGGSLTNWLVDELRFGSSFGAVVSNMLRYEWNVNATGNWSANSNWFDGAPNASGQSAVFGSAITTPQTITVDTPRTVSALSFNNLNSYTLAGSTITLSSSGSAAIDVMQGGHTINAPLTLTANTIATIAANSTLTINGGVTNTATVSLTKAGDGTLKMPNVHAGALQITGGRIDIMPHGAGTHLSRVSDLSITSGATLNLADNDLIIDYSAASPLATLQALLHTGYANGSWAGSGLTSSSAQVVAADGSNLHKTGLGVIDTARLMLGNFDGESVDQTTLLIRYTYLGDSNLDGVVNTLDFNALATHFGATTGAGWLTGDSNYDGTINSMDFDLLASNFGMSNAISGPALMSLVPEPSTFMLLSLAVPMGIRRRRR